MIQATTLLSGVQIPSSVTILFTCPQSTTAIITHAVFTNTDNSNRTVTAYVVPAGAEADNTTIVMDAQSVSANSSLVAGALIGCVLGPGDTLQMLASVGAKVAVYLSGFTQS